MSVATRGLATGVGLAAILIIYRLLGVDQMAHVFKKKELRDKYDFVVGNLSLFRRRTRASYVYIGCLAWYNCMLYNCLEWYK